MKYLLDTGVLIHNLIAQSKLNRRALELLADNSSELYLSAASSWEITIKAGTGKLALPERPTQLQVRWPGGKSFSAAIPKKAREIQVDVEGTVKLVKSE